MTFLDNYKERAINPYLTANNLAMREISQGRLVNAAFYLGKKTQ
jgi:hypothetical protein